MSTKAGQLQHRAVPLDNRHPAARRACDYNRRCVDPNVVDVVGKHRNRHRRPRQRRRGVVTRGRRKVPAASHAGKPYRVGTRAHGRAGGGGNGNPSRPVEIVLAEAVPSPGILLLVDAYGRGAVTVNDRNRDVRRPGGIPRPPHEHLVHAGRLGSKRPAVRVAVPRPQAVGAIGRRAPGDHPGSRRGGPPSPIVDHHIRQRGTRKQEQEYE